MANAVFSTILNVKWFCSVYISCKDQFKVPQAMLLPLCNSAVTPFLSHNTDLRKVPSGLNASTEGERIFQQCHEYNTWILGEMSYVQSQRSSDIIKLI